jgi:undecaprenyl diphosphate synthase
MDGNGRWAQARHQDRVFGHVKGARVAKKIVEHATRLKLQALTLYAFSEENWGRPLEEVNFLMRLLRRYIVRERKSLVENNILFRCIGNLAKLPDSVRAEVQSTMLATRENTGMQLTFALSYGGRQEITEAVQNIAQLAANNTRVRSGSAGANKWRVETLQFSALADSLHRTLFLAHLVAGLYCG